MKRWLVVLAACGTPQPAGPPTNATPPADKLALADSELGLVALAPGIDWIPQTEAAALAPVEGIDPKATFRAIDSRGGTAELRDATIAKVKHGCDDNELELTLFRGGKLAPGAVWLVPAGTAWTPTAIPVVRPAASAASARYAIGPVSITATRTGDATGTLAFTWRGKPVFERPIQRGDMAGAPKDAIDLDAGGPGVPQPIAAWQVGGERGSMLVVFREPSYEGEHIFGVVLDEDRGRAPDAMKLYLYRCAF